MDNWPFTSGINAVLLTNSAQKSLQDPVNAHPKDTQPSAGKRSVRPSGAGAVARCVSNGLTGSRFAEAAEVFGQPLRAQPFDTAPYQALAPKLGWLLGRNRGMAYAYLDHINRFGAPDMVEVHNRCQVAAIIKRKRPDLKVVLHLHNDPRGMKAGISTTARAWLRENLDGIFCVSGYIRQCVLDGLPEDKALDSKVMVTLNGCDRTAASPPEKQKLICVVGRMVPEKGMLETARAAAEIMPQHPQWKIVFIGARGYGNTPPSAYENEVLSALSLWVTSRNDRISRTIVNQAHSASGGDFHRAVTMAGNLRG